MFAQLLQVTQKTRESYNTTHIILYTYYDSGTTIVKLIKMLVIGNVRLFFNKLELTKRHLRSLQSVLSPKFPSVIVRVSFIRRGS